MQIEKNLPMPKESKRGRPSIYNFHLLEVGDSYFFPGETSGGRARIAASSYSTATGVKFSGRVVDGGLRIWRIK